MIETLTSYVSVCVCLVGEVVMDFLDVAPLPSRASVFTTFLTNCGRGESLGTTTCLNPVVGGRQGHTPC